MKRDYRNLFNPSRMIYVGLRLNYHIVEGTKMEGGNMDDYPSLKKAAINVTRAAQKLEIPKGDLTEDEAVKFSNALEFMLQEFPEAKV